MNSKLNYQKKLGHWDQVNLLAKQILQYSPDQWNVYLDYITSALHLADSENENLPETVNATVNEATNFITRQQEENSKCRGPYLAKIELQSRLLAKRDKDVKIGN